MTSKEVVEIIKNSQNIAIFSHRSPDPDACGSLFAVKDICLSLGKNAEVFLKESVPSYLDCIFPIKEVKHDFKNDNYDLVIFVDIHTTNRMEDIFKDEVNKATNVLIIDHHEVSEDVFSYKNYIIKPEYASTTQILTEIIKDNNIEISSKTANYLYSGLMGDTDRFLHPNLSKKVFETAMYLLEKGADVQSIYDFMYRFKTKKQLSVNKFILENIKCAESEKCAYVVVTQKDLKRLKANIEDVKFFSNDLMYIKGIKISFLAYEKSKNLFKISLRSNGKLNTLNLSRKFGGGGHINASGFETKSTKSELMSLIPKWAKELLND